MALPKTTINKQRLLDTKVKLEHTISDAIGGMENVSALKRLMIMDAIKDASYWTEVVQTLQDDIEHQGVTINKLGTRKNSSPRQLIENPLVSILYKMQPRKTDAMKRLYKLCSEDKSVEDTTDKDALYRFCAYDSE